MIRRSTHRVLLTTCLVSIASTIDGAALAAQSAVPRIPIRGVANRIDGSAWSGASIHCRVLIADGPFDSEASEELIATTDAKGQFQLRTLLGREHVLWAEAPREDGSLTCSTAPVRALSGARVTLVEDATTCHARTLNIVGLDAAAAPFRLRLSEPALGRARWLELDADSRCTLPAGPHVAANVTVIDRFGITCLSSAVPIPAPDSTDPLTITRGPHRPIAIGIGRNYGKGDPKNARVILLHECEALELGRADAHGWTVFDLGFLGAAVPSPIPAFACIADDLHPFNFDPADAELNPSTGFVQLGQGSTVLGESKQSGQLHIDGVPLDNATLRFPLGTMHDTDSTGDPTDHRWSLHRQTSADGSFDLSGEKLGSRPVEVLLGPRQLALLPAAWQSITQSSLFFSLPDDGSLEPIDVDLARELRAFEFVVLDTHQNVAANAELIVCSGFVMRARTDSRGIARVVAPVRMPNNLCVGVCEARGWTCVSIDPRAARRLDAEVLRINLELSPSVQFTINLENAADPENRHDARLELTPWRNSEEQLAYIEVPLDATRRSLGDDAADLLDPTTGSLLASMTSYAACGLRPVGKQFVLALPTFRHGYDLSISTSASGTAGSARTFHTEIRMDGTERDVSMTLKADDQ